MDILCFIASPGDVRERREPVDHVVAQINQSLESDHRATLRVVRWEDDAPRGPAQRLQGAINPLLDQCDIMLGIFWRRCGTPTVGAASGTEEEYIRSFENWRTRGYPIPLLYFCEMPAPPPRTVKEAKQLVQVARIRESASKQVLTGSYKTTEAFMAMLHRDLYRIAVEASSLRRLPIERGLAFSLWRERENCRRADRPFHTPSLLCALLKRQYGILRLAFEGLEPGLAAEIQGWMEKAEDQLSSAPDHVFEPFEWLDRSDIANAVKLARAEGDNETDDRNLARAIFAGEGSTVSAIRRRLGESAFCRLVTMLETRAVGPGYGSLLGQAERGG